MGAKNLDLTPLLQYVKENMEQYYGESIYSDLTGTLTVYEIFKVAEVQTTQYKVEISVGVEMDVSGTVSIAAESGSLDFSLVAKADGFAYFTKDTLALAKEELSGDMDLTMSIEVAGRGGGTTMDATFQETITYSPALDIFNFPITVGDSWTAESTAALTGTISGTMSIPGFGEQSVNIPLDNTTSVSVSLQCPSTANVTLEDGSVSTCYKITQPGVSVGEVTPTSLGGTVYYSPDRGFIVKQDLLRLPGTAGKAGGMSLGGIGSTASLGSINPVTEQEARDAIAEMGKEGINMVLIGAIIAIVVIVLIALVALSRRRRTVPVYW